MEIGNVKLKSKFILAPMAGFTDAGFRSICSSFGCGLTVSEMISAKGLLYKSENTQNLLEYEENEKPKAVQIFSREPEIVQQILEQGNFADWDILDINMGCPVPKIVKEKMGSYLMKDMLVAESVIKSAVKYANKPVTVKFRAGFNENCLNAPEFASMCESAGASAVCVHGRTREQMYAGKADLDIIAKVKQAVKIPVFGNGDITNKQQADIMFETTGCDGIAIGRGALGKPWIFAELQGKEVEINLIDIVKTHIDILKKHLPEKLVLLHMRKHLASYISNVKNAKNIRHRLTTSTSFDEVFSILQNVKIEN
ncbi:MAG: tRNA dihydrouridine synthase DusB [Clostridia bacterium]|nr:tRNA dihydrouridine synthase DusB [Clostridia bacterium]